MPRPAVRFKPRALASMLTASCTTITVVGVRGTGAAGGTGTNIHSGSVYGSGGLANVRTTANLINSGTAASVH